MVYQIKVTLNGIRPSIWRRILVRDSTTLGQLHEILQVVMGWDNCHLHEFEIDGRRYGSDMDEFGDFESNEEVRDENGARLSEVIGRPGTTFSYLYDFGDNWEHILEAEEIIPEEKGKRYPVCLEGRRACPPDDCGGIWGYQEILEAREDPDNPDFEELQEWVGEFDPEAFDPDEVNRSLR